ncbi:Crp/Fnr family transcriptional regulator [Senegalia massiliensis]|uniref:Crp/Fnr family transcriptional regulator n=1 Tax=Senegalia massiliensis TaxID=1720316 RepID=A0A845QY92_9CLOT|nr:Crp/Fnr family transcriptional regulator [Senegalia massiliensis]NBI06118.1 Crp/Fnr family transcriptional regulator [Senegalia massiliensis]
MLNRNDIDILKNNLNFWSNLDEKDKNLIINNSIIRKFEKNETIHSNLNSCSGVLIVKSGIIRTYLLSEEGKEVTLYRVNKGETCVLSASCAIKNINFDVHIDSETISEIISIDINVINKLSKNLYVENFLLKQTVNRFSDVMFAIEQILFLKFDQRLASFLLDESYRNEKNVLTLTHEQIAKHLGTAREVVSRMLKHFSKEGYVMLSRGKITILNNSALEKLI